jgi:PAS domain S-box-containing protein
MRRNSALASFEDDFETQRQGLGPDAEIMLRLQQISTLLISEGTNGAIYERVLDAAVDLMSADKATMQVFHPERGELRLLVQRGFDPQVAARWEWIGYDVPTTCSMALLAGSRVIVSDFETCETMAGRADLDAFRRSDVRAAQSTPLMSRSGSLLGMVTTYWRKPHRLTDRELQPLDVLARQAADLIERNKAEAALRESREQFRWLASIVEFSDDAIVSKNLDGIITSWNRGAERVFGYLAEEVIGKPIAILIPPERYHEENVILERIRRGDRVDHFETVRRRKDGNLINMSLTISPMRDASGRVLGASTIARDITERKQNEALISTLAREVEHRAKNLLANVKAVVHLSRAGTPDGLKKAIEGRIDALANVHSLFAQSRWRGAELSNLVKQELSPYSHDGEERTWIDGPTVMLKPDVAQAIAVALHELATNAVKYGALSGAKGEVHVTWSCAADDRVALRWTEAGGPPVNPPTQRGFGTDVIGAMIQAQVGGDMRLDWRTEGLQCEIALPAVMCQREPEPACGGTNPRQEAGEPTSIRRGPKHSRRHGYKLRTAHCAQGRAGSP